MGGFPRAEILREAPPVPGGEPMPGLPTAPPPPPAAPPPPLTMEQGMADVRRGADLTMAAAQRATERQQEIDTQRAQAQQAEQERTAPLWAGLHEAVTQPQPGVVAPPELPAPPSSAVRPFASGVEGEPPEQALQRAVMGLTLLAQMGFGAAAGVPELSLRALAGAMKGWQEGDLIRGDREFGEWQATVHAMQQDYANRRQHIEDIVARNRGDMERLRTALMLELSAGELSRRDYEALTQSAQAFFAHDAAQGQALRDVGQTTVTVASNIDARNLERLRYEQQAQRDAALFAIQAAKLKLEQAKEARESGPGVPKLSDISTMRQQFLGQSKDFVTIRDSYERLLNATQVPSAAGDLALIFNYMKMLDPNSVVREAEFATAQNAAGVPERVRAQWNRALNGERLSEETRKDFVTQAGGQFAAQLRGQVQLENQFGGLAEQSGMPRNQVVVDFIGAFRSPQKTDRQGGSSSTSVQDAYNALRKQGLTPEQAKTRLREQGHAVD